MGERCYRLIGPYLGDSAQVLPAAWGSEAAYVLNVTRVIDCLDEERSKLKRFPSTGRVMRIEEYAFDKALVEDEVIFKIPEEAPAHDCLDEERSKLKRFPSTGRVMRIEEYAFDKALVEDEVIFKIPEEAPAHPYVTDKLKAVIERNGIRGFKFIPVWKG